ncbi:MAG: SRPBCC domain-containing protein, partial [Bacteroidota bacterium]
MTTATKILLGLGALGLPAVLLAATGRKSVNTEILIPASPEAVWAVLSDPAGFSTWNPVIVEVDGAYREGERVTSRVVMDGEPTTMNSRVVRVEPNRLLNQRGGPFGVLTFDHTWELTPVEGGTRVTQHEVYRGIGVWFW